MKLEQLKSLTEDELAMLWYCVNKINPPVLTGVELDPSLFVAIKHKALMNRLLSCAQYVKDEHREVYAGLMNKLKV